MYQHMLNHECGNIHQFTNHVCTACLIATSIIQYCTVISPSERLSFLHLLCVCVCVCAQTANICEHTKSTKEGADCVSRVTARALQSFLPIVLLSVSLLPGNHSHLPFATSLLLLPLFLHQQGGLQWIQPKLLWSFSSENK